jgi:ABC-2 type transport system ATP-binding protein
MIEVKGLTKRFGAITALSDVSFSVERGQIVGFLGANGAGKTTTMDILCGCIGADKGSVKVAGIDVTEKPEAAKMHFGYLPDDPPLYTDMRVEEFITFVAKIHKVPSNLIKGRVTETLDKLSLGEVRKRLVGNLSKGFRQRVGLAQAIVHKPDVLIFDEPTEGLDPNQIIHIRELIRSLGGEHTILLSSHILSEVQNTCDHIIIIHQGKIIQQGTYEELARKAHSGNDYRLVVARNSAKLVQEISKVAGVSDARVVNSELGKIEFSVLAGDEVVDQVARKVVDGNHGLKELVLGTKSLEEVFFQLTH